VRHREVRRMRRLVGGCGGARSASLKHNSSIKLVFWILYICRLGVRGPFFLLGSTRS